MRALPWLVAWLHEGESFWSVANKIAYVLQASVRDVLDILLGPLRLRREALLFTDMPTALEVCMQLELPVTGAGGAMFANIGGTPELGVRERWCLRIRYCPACIEGCVHRTAFQDQTVTHCLVHKLRLKEGCGYCGRAVDPLCSWAWRCNHCERPLADPGASWSQIFRRGPCDGAMGEASDVSLPQPSVDVIPPWKLIPHVYEEHAAIAHALLARHRDCAERHAEASLTYVDDVHFECPLAAAVLVCGAKLGLSAGAMCGGWPAGQSVNCYRSGFPDLQTLLWGTPESQVPSRVRLAARIMAVKCLQEFLGAARRGQSVASVILGRYSSFAQPEDAISLASLPALAEEAGRYCRLQTISTQAANAA